VETRSLVSYLRARIKHERTFAHNEMSLCLCIQRVPTFLGSIENVFELDQFYKYYSDESEDE